MLLTANQKSVKLADFGLAREETVTEMMTAETGTYRWMAPEVCANFNKSSWQHVHLYTILFFAEVNIKSQICVRKSGVVVQSQCLYCR